MTIRSKLTLWYSGMLLGSLLLMGGVLHYELIGEYEKGKVETPAVKIADVLESYGVPTVIVLVLGGSWLMRRAMRPIEMLASTAERVHARNLSERIPLSGRDDELDRLAGVFNAMLARLEAGMASVRDFTLHASHELKTPLTILSAETELALGDPTISAGHRELLASQFEEIRRLATLVDALSLLAKADAGMPVTAPEPLRFDEMVRAAVENARVIAGPLGIAVELARCDEAPLVADRAGLRQVLLNLLDNAVKHNCPRGRVGVELRAGSDAFTLSIENTGTPIPLDLAPRIFDRFVRGPGVTEGTGLGLSIVKTIVQAHGGTVSCSNRSDGIVQFLVRLPRT